MTTSGVESFYRDGYTDIRGKFEYLVSSGSTDLKSIKKFAILVQSEHYGSVIREVCPPKDEQVPVVINKETPYVESKPQSIMQQK